MKNGWDQLAELVDKISNDPNERKITLAIGAGIHQLHRTETYEQNEAKKVLASWDGLLNSIGSLPNSAQTSPLRWELLLLQETVSGLGESLAIYPASEREKKLNKHVSNIIHQAEDTLSRNRQEDFYDLISITNSPVVSDIISYNVDLSLQNVMPGKVEKSGIISDTMSCHYKVSDDMSGDGNMRIWYPHGIRTSPNTLSFGVWKYHKYLEPINKIRRHYKQNEREFGYDFMNESSNTTTWFHLFMRNPIIFIGSSLDVAEIDLWYSLVVRWRNYSKMSNRYEPKIWRLCVPNEGLQLPSSKILRLEGPSWASAWRYLNSVLNT